MLFLFNKIRQKSLHNGILKNWLEDFLIIGYEKIARVFFEYARAQGLGSSSQEIAFVVYLQACL